MAKLFCVFRLHHLQHWHFSAWQPSMALMTNSKPRWSRACPMEPQLAAWVPRQASGD